MNNPWWCTLILYTMYMLAGGIVGLLLALLVLQFIDVDIWLILQNL